MGRSTVSPLLVLSAAWFAFDAASVQAQPDARPKTETGVVSFKPNGDASKIPARYRLNEHSFTYEMTLKKTLPGIGVEIIEVKFPSPVKSRHDENNTVHAEWYRPVKIEGKIPCVIVLDITGGNQELSRIISRHLAQHGIGGLFVQMSYYGPRRPAGSKMRFLSYDVDQTIENVRQTVLDLRRAAAWMESRPEVDASRLGIMGTSLGSFIAALTCQMEPKLGRLTVMLGGGGFVDGFWDHPLAKPYRQTFEAFGGTKEMVQAVIAPIDPITNAHLLRERKVLIVAAKNDEIVPPRMAENLWKASGQQRIIWLDAGHYSAALYLVTGLRDVVKHFNDK